MKRIYLVFAVLAVGFINAFTAAGVSSVFFALLPIIAFAFGYFSSWRWGLLCGFLLYVGYTFTLSIIWYGPGSANLLYPIPYIGAFIAGGFSLPLIGALAPLVNKGVRRFGSILVLAIMAIVAGWCGYTSLPHYSYYYQVTIQSTESLNKLELYLPVGTVSGEPYETLYAQPFELDHLWMAPDNYSLAIADTEYGKMLKLAFPSLKKDNVPQPRYTANIIFSESMRPWQESAPRQLIQLMPKFEVAPVNTVDWQQSVGPVKNHESLIVERFQVPVKITASSPAPIKLTMWNRTDRIEALNFTYTYSKNYPYTERINYDLRAGDNWVFVPVEATIITEIRGISD